MKVSCSDRVKGKLSSLTEVKGVHFLCFGYASGSKLKKCVALTFAPLCIMGLITQLIEIGVVEADKEL